MLISWALFANYRCSFVYSLAQCNIISLFENQSLFTRRKNHPLIACSVDHLITWRFRIITLDGI